MKMHRWHLLCCMLWLTACRSQTNNTSDSSEEPVEDANATVVPMEQPACYDNLTQVSLDILEKNPLEVVRYILCPNTIFEVGIERVDVDLPFITFTDGMSGLWIRENSHILCGEDGSSENNCTIVSGNAHVYSYFSRANHKHDSNLLSGITFGRTLFSPLSHAGSGDVTFRDCVFRVSCILCKKCLSLMV